MVTIKDVAQRAGVNPSTVSRVLKDSSAISPKTKAKVKKAMDELGYVPNRAAQMLASGMTQCVGVVLPPFQSTDRISDPFFMEILTTINNEAKLSGYSVAIATGESEEDLTQQVELMFRQRRADGFLILYSKENDPVRAYLEANRIPFIIVGSVQEEVPAATYVDNDNRAMGARAVSYLKEKGHEKILFVSDDLNNTVLKERYWGYCREKENLGLTVYPFHLFDHRDPLSLAQFIERIGSEGITALVVAGDLLALRVLQFLSYHNYQVPDDVSIITFNDSVFAEMLHPYLTTFDINIGDLGRVSFDKFLENIRHKKQVGQKLEVAFTLKERESVRNLLK